MAARDRLAEARRNSPLTGKPRSRNERSATTLFSGTLFCGYCGKEIVLDRSTKKYKVMGCRNGRMGSHDCQLTTSKSTTILENCLLDFIRNTLFTDHAIDEELVHKANAYLAAEASKPQIDVAPLQRLEKDLVSKLKKLLNAIENANDDANLDSLRIRIKERQQELDGVRREIKSLQRDKSAKVRPFHRRITGRKRSSSYPKALRLAVLNSNRLALVVASSPIQREASTRIKCPLEKTSTFPATSRNRATTRSALALTCRGVSPLGHPSRNSNQSGRSERISAPRRPSYSP